MRIFYQKFLVNRTNNVPNRTAQSCEFCVQHIFKNGLIQLKNVFYSILLLNLDLVLGRHRFNRVATSPEAQNTFSVLIRSFLNVLSCNFIFSIYLPRVFRHINFNLIR
ncbi:hypothetical protein O3M35_011216 [Rhynocoris fuscipes]|uniref:Uncharacterized protein n=1 Tax=Rhynocoris fuscipes TaxID=488301 RepID=A0AAW1D1I6_9HEMI